MDISALLGTSSYTPAANSTEKEQEAPEISFMSYLQQASVVSGASTLSSEAEAYLEELKVKFPDTDFFIESFSSNAEANAIMQEGSNAFGCVITPALLEKMAADPAIAEEYEQIIADNNEQLSALTGGLDGYDEQYERVGFSIDSEGNTTFFCLFSGDEEAVTASSAEELLSVLLERFAPDELTEIERMQELEEIAEVEPAPDAGLEQEYFAMLMQYA